MKKRNLLLYYDIFLHVINFTPARKIANLHGVSVQSIYKKIKWLEKEGIIKQGRNNTARKGSTFYVAGPGAPAFLNAVEELGVAVEQENRGAILSAPPSHSPFTSQPSTSPTLDFYSGRAPRVHRLVFVVDLQRPTSRSGLRFRLPRLPDSITWKKVWEHKSGHYKLGYVKIVGMEKPAAVQYSISRKRMIERLQITIPALFVLKEWIEAYEDIRMYFYEIAYGIAKEFQKSGYIISQPRPIERSGEMAFFLPVLSEIPQGDLKKYIRAQKITDKVWVDYSHGFLEIETRDPDEGKKITSALQLLLELPNLKSKVEEHDKMIHQIIETESALTYQQESAPPGGMYR